jgi:hypothetical protein
MFWVPGSCGDIVQHILSHNVDVCTGATYNLNDQGRAVRTMTDAFTVLFPSEPGRWLRRTWTIQDCDQLVDLAKSQTVIIGTHDYNQVRFLKEHLRSNIETVGINYDQNMWPIVLKNFCFKAIQFHTNINFMYQSANPNLYKKFKDNNVLGAWILQEQLLHTPDDTPNTVNYLFDHTIFLDHLLIGNLQWASQFQTPQSLLTFQRWLSVQNLLGCVKIPDNVDFATCLGRNRQATIEHPFPIVLDNYDKIFIKHYVKKHNLPNCRATTHYELLDFFITNPSKNLSQIENYANY